MNLQPILISAPFGNYIQPKACTPTLGTFTIERRGGPIKRLWRAMLTLRPVPGGWRNKMALPNGGLHYTLSQSFTIDKKCYNDKIISVHAMKPDDWSLTILGAWVYDPLGIELNVSCPNINQSSISDYHNLAKTIKSLPNEIINRIIIKLPPIRWMDIMRPFYDAGVRYFHACNTIWSPRGGYSGKMLMPYSLWAVEQLRDYAPDVLVIGGGGVTSTSDVRSYVNAGAHHISVGGYLFVPWRAKHLTSWSTVLAETRLLGKPVPAK